MFDKINYEYLEEVGPYGVKFIKDLGQRRSSSGKTSRRYAIFQCPYCQKEFESSIRNIKSGSTRSCGCYRKQAAKERGRKNAKDLSGQHFGKLLAIEPTKERKRGNVVWKCLCECGNYCYVCAVDLLRKGDRATRSCGCINSFAEQEIKEILQNNNVNFISQKVFSDCKNPKTDNCLFFDFYLPDYNCCIEYDGRQHYKEKSFGKWDELEKIQYRDSIKNKYCEDNDIKLIRIPYTEKNKINYDYIMKLVLGE